jgi:hypothetical protein
MTLNVTTISVFGMPPHPISGLVGDISWLFPPVGMLVGMTGHLTIMVATVILQ